MEAARRGRLDQALRAIERALDEGPANARYWKDQGVLLRASGDPFGAERSLRHALELSPAYPEARAELEALLRERGDERALAELAGGSAADGGPEPVAVLELGAPPAIRYTGAVDWRAVHQELERRGACRLPGLLAGDQDLAPDALARELYAGLAPFANRWQAALDRRERFPRFVETLRAQPAPPPFPFAVALARADGCTLTVTDARLGKRVRATRLLLDTGDAAVHARTERLVSIGGVFGRMPVGVTGTGELARIELDR